MAKRSLKQSTETGNKKSYGINISKEIYNKYKWIKLSS